MIPDDLQHLDASKIAARHTIDFTTRQSLIDLVLARAAVLGIAPEALAAKLAAKAMVLFQEETETVNPSEVIANWTAKANAHAGADTPWSFVTHRPLVMKLRLTACEFDLTTSAMANLFLAKGFEHHTEQGI